MKMVKKNQKSVLITVAHPDDETLWVGGTILSNPLWECFIICLSRKNDSERAARFYQALKVLNSEGVMGDLDDGPEQKPLNDTEVEHTILDLLPEKHFDLIISHNPSGEYTRHLRHEEVSKAMLRLWQTRRISASELWTFAYEDGNKKYFPQAIEMATIHHLLTTQIWLRKYNIITDIYGFKKDSWEAQTTPKSEAFWQFTDPNKALKL